MKKYKYIFFDLDGTLTDPFEGITHSVALALEHFGIYVKDRSELGKFIGPPLRESFPKYYPIPADRVEEAVEEYRKYFSVKGLFENEMYAGVPEMLSALRDAGYTILLATAKPEVYAKRITEHFGIDGFFFAQCGASLDGVRDSKASVIKYALSVCKAAPDEVLMIGDRSHDVLGAKEHGVDTAGVLWGYGSSEELESAGAVCTFGSVDSLTGYLLDRSN